MKPTISALWNGNLTPWEEVGVHHKELMQLNKITEECKEALLALLGENGEQAIEEFENALTDWECLEMEDAFIKGFCLGAKLVIESMTAK